jgi:hypothetical protein
MNPTRYFEITGSASPSARRLAVVARALNRPVIAPDAESAASAIAGSFPASMATTTLGGDDPAMLWRYIVDVRSLGKNPLDSLARLSKIDIGKQIVPYLAPSMALGYSGVDFLKRDYGYSNTAFNMLAGFPLRGAPPRFDSTLRVFFGRITSLVYTPEMLPNGSTRLWIASDTTTNDSLLRERKLQPSFAVVGDRTLIVASTPSLLRGAVMALTTGTSDQGFGATGYLAGTMRVDSFSTNTIQYVKNYLIRTDRYNPKEITSRLDPLRSALALYDRLTWRFTVENGLRKGEATLVAKK